MLFDEKQQSIINSLTPKQVEALTELLNEEESVTSVPLATNVDTEAMNAPLAEALWLHQRQVRRCYYFYAKHEYEAWVTLGKDGPRRSVAKIELHIDRERDGAHYTHTCKNTDYCNKTDKVYFTGNACGGRSCVQSTATDEVYGVWSAPHSCID